MIVRGAQKTVRNAETLAFDLGPVTAGEHLAEMYRRTTVSS